MVHGLINRAFVAPAEKNAWTLGVLGSRISRATSSEVSKWHAFNSGLLGHEAAGIWPLLHRLGVGGLEQLLKLKSVWSC